MNMTKEELKELYVTGEMSLAELSEETGVAGWKINRWSKKEKWSQERTKYRREVAAKNRSRARTRDISKLKALQKAADNAVASILKVTEDAEQMFLHVYSDPVSGVKCATKLHAANMEYARNMAATLKDLTYTVRNLYGLAASGDAERKNERDERKLKLAEQAAAIRNEDEGGGVIVLAQREDENETTGDGDPENR